MSDEQKPEEKKPEPPPPLKPEDPKPPEAKEPEEKKPEPPSPMEVHAALEQALADARSESAVADHEAAVARAKVSSLELQLRRSAQSLPTVHPAFLPGGVPNPAAQK